MDFSISKGRWLLVLAGGAAVVSLMACGGGGDPTPTLTPSLSSSATPTSPPGVTPGPGVSDSEIRLGMTNDLAGEGGTPYAAVTASVQAYFAQVNGEKGGVCGRDVVVIAADDRYTPEIALEETKRLVEEEDVLAVIGAQSTEVHLAVAPYLNDPDGDEDGDDGVPDLFLSTGWSGWGIVERFPWSIGFIPDYASDGEIIAKYINEHLSGTKVGLLYENSSFGRDYRAALERVFVGDDVLVASVAYDVEQVEDEAEPTPADGEDPTPTPAVRPLLQELIDAGAEVVVLGTTPTVSAEVFKIANAGDIISQFILSYVNTPSTLAAEIGGGTQADSLLEGFQILSGSIVLKYMLNVVEDEGSPGLIEHQRIMETYDGPPVTTLSIYGQALAETVVETLSRACDQLDREGVLQAAESLSGFHPSLLLPGIEVILSSEDHRAIETMQPVMIEADGSLSEIGSPISAEG